MLNVHLVTLCTLLENIVAPSGYTRNKPPCGMWWHRGAKEFIFFKEFRGIHVAVMQLVVGQACCMCQEQMAKYDMWNPCGMQK